MKANLNSEKTQQEYTVVPVVRHEFIPAPVHQEEFNRKSIFPLPLSSLYVYLECEANLTSWRHVLWVLLPELLNRHSQKQTNKT